jgi:hypothetical protein
MGGGFGGGTHMGGGFAGRSVAVGGHRGTFDRGRRFAPGLGFGCSYGYPYYDPYSC